MATVRSVQNQYRGINAHLHSRLKSENEWANFHVNFICDVTRLMQPILFPLGYRAYTGQSLQIRRYAESGSNKESDYYHAVGICREDEQPVVWLELLSPSSIARLYAEGSVYRAKRGSPLQDGIPFVEIDFFHEHPPEPGAHP